MTKKVLIASLIIVVILVAVIFVGAQGNTQSQRAKSAFEKNLATEGFTLQTLGYDENVAGIPNCPHLIVNSTVFFAYAPKNATIYYGDFGDGLPDYGTDFSYPIHIGSEQACYMLLEFW